MSAVGNESEQTYQLEASLPDWCVLRWHHALVCLVFVTIYLYFSYLPIPVANVWHSVWSGSWIVQHGLFDQDPSLPLSEGIRTINLNWLSSVILYKVHAVGGANALSIFFALVQTLTLILWGYLFQKMTGKWWCALAAVICFFAGTVFVGSPSSSCFGGLCFVLLVFVVTQRTDEMEWANATFGRWLAAAIIMIAWTNLDSSFVVGLAWVAALVIGRLIDDLRGFHSLKTDLELRHRVWLFECLVLATLVTPLGWGLWKALLWWPDNPLIQAFGSWQPTTLASIAGLLIAASWGIWFVAARSAKRINSASVVVPVFATFGVAICSPAIIWFAPLMIISACSLLQKQANDSSVKPSTAEALAEDEPQRPLRFAFTLICGLLVWIAFSLSPISQPILGGTERSAEQLMSKHTPIGVREFLKANRPQGLVWIPQYWSDFIQPEGESISVFANLNFQSIPRLAQEEYQLIYSGNAAWPGMLERYAITDLIIDKRNQTRLYRAVRKTPHGWQTVFEDHQVVVLRQGNTLEKE